MQYRVITGLYRETDTNKYLVWQNVEFISYQVVRIVTIVFKSLF
jgi:hypothetical protein